MIASQKPVVTVVHSLPGRVRVRISAGPRDVQRMLAGVREHPGMESISFSPITRSILARFNPHEISQEEIALRIAFHLSLDCDSAPVRLLAEPEERPALGGIAAVSAAALALSLVMHGLKLVKGSPTRWDRLAGLGTAWAVVDTPRRSFVSAGRSTRKCSRWLTWSQPLFAATSSRPRSSLGLRPSDGTWWRLLPLACKSGLWKYAVAATARPATK